MTNVAIPIIPSLVNPNRGNAPFEPATSQNQEEVKNIFRPESSDIVSLSPQAKESAEKQQNPNELNDEEEKEIKELKQRDREVKAHEQAHKSAGGQYAGAASYTYTTGPDNHRYATGGEVPIDVSPIPDDPQATIRKMDIVKRAALAPAEPSGADRSVYAQATQNQSKARQEIVAEKIEEAQELGKSDDKKESKAISQSISLVA